jgi:hypothetical protein
MLALAPSAQEPTLMMMAEMTMADALGQFGFMGAALLAAGPLVILCSAVPRAVTRDAHRASQRPIQASALVAGLIPMAICVYALVFRQVNALDKLHLILTVPVYVAVVAEVVAVSTLVQASWRRGRLGVLGACGVSLLATMFVAFVGLCLIGGEGP